MNKSEMKKIAIEHLKALNIYRPYITEFRKNGTVTMFERFGGYYINEMNGYTELESRIKEFERDYEAMVYAVTHEYLEFGECYTFLYVDKNDPNNLTIDDGLYYVYAYVWNKTMEYCSEFGTVGIQSSYGGIVRRE